MPILIIEIIAIPRIESVLTVQWFSSTDHNLHTIILVNYYYWHRRLVKAKPNKCNISHASLETIIRDSRHSVVFIFLIQNLLFLSFVCHAREANYIEYVMMGTCKRAFLNEYVASIFVCMNQRLTSSP